MDAAGGFGSGFALGFLQDPAHESPTERLQRQIHAVEHEIKMNEYYKTVHLEQEDQEAYNEVIRRHHARLTSLLMQMPKAQERLKQVYRGF